jgi:hypothetical protein
VTREQMFALFAARMHPLATQRLEQLPDANLTEANIQTAWGAVQGLRHGTAPFWLRCRSVRVDLLWVSDHRECRDSPEAGVQRPLAESHCRRRRNARNVR